MASEVPTTGTSPLFSGQSMDFDLDELAFRAVWNCKGMTGWRFTASTPGDTWPTGTVPIVTIQFGDTPLGPWYDAGATIDAIETSATIGVDGLWSYISAYVSTAGSSSNCTAQITGHGTALTI
jgi:hypothetical protein